MGKVFIPYGYNKPQSELTEEEQNNHPHAFLEFKHWYQEKNTCS